MLVATLTSSFNRKDKTLKSLGQLFKDTYPKNFKIKHYLVDDCSTDGTPELVKKHFNSVKIIKTSGGLYWSRSIRQGWDFIKKDIAPDFLFVYNDDSNFYPNCINTLLQTHKNQIAIFNEPVVVVGALVDPYSLNATYGGRSRHKLKFFTLSSRLLPIKNSPQLAYTLNFNAALIPISVIEKIGFVAPYFLHGGADWEFGYNCTKNKIPIIQANGAVGTCQLNPDKGTSRESKISLIERYKRLLSIKEQPFMPRFKFAIRYGGFFFLVQLFLPYFKVLIVHMIDSFSLNKIKI